MDIHTAKPWRAESKNYTIDQILIKKGFDMKGETDLIKEVLSREGKNFSDFNIGEGYVDHLLAVRVKITNGLYIYVNSNQVQVNGKEDWPLDHPTKTKHFKIIVKEI